MVACVPHVKPTRVVDGVKVTIVLDQSWPNELGQACPAAKALPSGLVAYIEDYARASLTKSVTERSEPPKDIEVDPKNSSLSVRYEGEGDWYCILLRGTSEGLLITLKYNGGWEF